jgi:hypothetical protein
MLKYNIFSPLFSNRSSNSLKNYNSKHLLSTLTAKKNGSSFKDDVSKLTPGDSSLPSKEFRDIGSSYTVNKFANESIFEFGSKTIPDVNLRRKFKIFPRVRSILYQAQLWADNFETKGEQSIRDVLNVNKRDSFEDLSVLYVYSYLQSISLGYYYHNNFSKELRDNTCLLHGHAALYKCLKQRYFSNYDSATGSVYLERELTIDKEELLLCEGLLKDKYNDLQGYNCLEPTSNSIVQLDRCLQRLEKHSPKKTFVVSLNDTNYLNSIFTDSNCPLGNSAFYKKSNSDNDSYIFINSMQERLDDISYAFNKANSIYLISLELDSVKIEDDVYNEINFDSFKDRTTKYDVMCISRQFITGNPNTDYKIKSNLKRPKGKSPNNDNNDDGDLGIPG